MTGGPNVVIGFSGAATIRQADDTAQRLIQALDQHDRIEVDCTAVTEADFSFIQLLIAARKSADASGKSLVLSAPATGALLEALTICGLDDSPRRDFWLKGREG